MVSRHRHVDERAMTPMSTMEVQYAARELSGSTRNCHARFRNRSTFGQHLQENENTHLAGPGVASRSACKPRTRTKGMLAHKEGAQQAWGLAVRWVEASIQNVASILPACPANSCHALLPQACASTMYVSYQQVVVVYEGILCPRAC